jgi:cell division protease FtsH
VANAEQKSRFIPLLLMAMLVMLYAARGAMSTSTATSRLVPYSDVVAAIESGRVEHVELHEDRLVGRLRTQEGREAEVLVAERLPGVDDEALLSMIREKGVAYSGKNEKGSGWATVLAFAPFVLLPLVFWIASGALAAQRGGKPMSFGKSKAKLHDRSRENQVTFADVAGVDEAKAELMEVVTFLRDPTPYREVGARVPKGVLLVGPPGTGKTLLAKAVAGESGVPFFSMSGSEFVEMFVGVGASRVRDLFEQAKARAPCIIFIDELDAVGKARAGAAGFASNEEREQTLNQLLVEMDGFDSGAGLVIMAATNRPEILDKALLRAGRFDRQVVVDRPDVRGRDAIVRVHAKKVKLGADADLAVVAHRTPGMVGADLANVVNEAALASVRRGSEHVDMVDFEEAIDRLQLGLKKEGRVMNDEEKRRVAMHEAGHALVALSVQHADPVHRVTIIPRSIGALGATLQLPTEERYLMTREELRDRLAVLFGGRAAEELAFGDVSTGAQNDLEQASELARRMTCNFGMSERLGAQTFGASGPSYLGSGELGRGRGYSDETARLIDREVRAVLDAEHARARAILTERRRALEGVATELFARETLDGPQLAAAVAAAEGGATEAAAAVELTAGAAAHVAAPVEGAEGAADAAARSEHPSASRLRSDGVTATA